MAGNVKRAADGTDGVDLLAFTSAKDGATTSLDGTITFNDARQIQFFVANLMQSQGLVTEGEDVPIAVDLTIRFPNLHFQRAIGFQEIVRSQEIPAFALSLLGDEARMRHIMHLPTAVTSHNASEISDDGKTLRWDFPLKQLLQTDAQMAFVAPLPYLKTAVVALALIILLIIFLVFRMLRKRSPRETGTKPTITATL